MTRQTVSRRRGAAAGAAPPLRVASVAVDATLTRTLRYAGDVADVWLRALREAMLKRGCLRDRVHKGQCLNCALLPRCGVWPLIAPADPTRRQAGAFTRAWVPQPPTLPAGIAPIGTRTTHALTMIQDGTFPGLWGRFAAAYVQASRQLAEWGIGQPAPTTEGPPQRGALSVGRVVWSNPVSGETAPFAVDETTPPVWYEEADANAEMLDMAGGTLRVTFMTPLRLVAAGEVRRRPDLPLLVRRVTERVTTLSTALRVSVPPSVAGSAADMAVAAAAQLRIARDETGWVGGHTGGGLVGSIALDGSPEAFAIVLPVLRWGMALAVGKGTQSGSGRFVIERHP